MIYEYQCRYCHIHLGSIDATGLSEQQLGFDRLTPEERGDIITSNVAGKTLIRVTCESCQEVLERYPERSILPYLIQ